MSAIIISRAFSEKSFDLEFLRNTAQYLRKKCIQSNEQPTYLDNLDDDKFAKEIVDLMASGKEILAFYGSTAGGFLTNSKGVSIFDLESSALKKYIQGKIFYVIDSGEGTLNGFGKFCIENGAKAYIGFKGRFKLFDDKKIIKSILENREATMLLFDLINYALENICHKKIEIIQAFDTIQDKCIELMKRNAAFPDTYPLKLPFCILKFAHSFRQNLDCLTPQKPREEGAVPNLYN